MGITRWLTATLGLVWLIGATFEMWLEGSQEAMGVHQSTYDLLVVVSLLGFVLGVALVLEGWAVLLLFLVPGAAFLATIAGFIGAADEAGGDSDPALTFILLAVVFGAPLISGAIVGAICRLVLKLVAARSARRAGDIVDPAPD